MLVAIEGCHDSQHNGDVELNLHFNQYCKDCRVLLHCLITIWMLVALKGAFIATAMGM